MRCFTEICITLATCVWEWDYEEVGGKGIRAFLRAVATRPQVSEYYRRHVLLALKWAKQPKDKWPPIYMAVHWILGGEDGL